MYITILSTHDNRVINVDDYVVYDRKIQKVVGTIGTSEMLEGRDDPVPKRNMRKVDPVTGIDLGLAYDPVGQAIDMSPGSLVGYGD